LELLRRPAVSYRALTGLLASRKDSKMVRRRSKSIQIKYQGYVDRQREEVARQRDFESIRLPADTDYRKVHGLSAEVQQKLNLHRPETLGQAARISGITPAAISLLLVHLKRGLGSGQAIDQSDSTRSPSGARQSSAVGK
jgi:tRNA uridine 5-carboxymethylaminomethyl modification enzyme